MRKRVSFLTRSLGSDAPIPDREVLAEWVGARRGKQGDLTTFRLEAELVPQIDAGVGIPCAGGKFYQDRLIDSFIGTEGRVITGEIGYDSFPLVKDAEYLSAIQKDLWFAFPSPGELRLNNRYYKDTDEVLPALVSVYHAMMRSMRDRGIFGHILHCDTPDKEELEALAGQKVFFFSHRETKKNLGLLLEYQDILAVRSSALGLVAEIMDDYDIQKIILVDAREEDLLRALEFRDAEHLICGGYCQDSCDQYWKTVVKNASVFR
ncbi:MAG TPA: hypothetical protein PKH71_00225 [Methanoregulaceae archaeon]|nr:hypothetical protein [Methanoregulaceae archaeon]